MSRRFNPTVWRVGDGNSKDDYIIIGIDKQKSWERVIDYLVRVIDLFTSHGMSPRHDGQFMYRLFLGGLRADILQNMLPMGPMIQFHVGIRHAVQWERQCNAEVKDLTEDDVFVYAVILDECDSEGEDDAEIEYLEFNDDGAQCIYESIDGQGVAQEDGAGNSTGDGIGEGTVDATGNGDFKEDKINMKDGGGECAGVDEGICVDVDEGVADFVGEDAGVGQATGNGTGMEEHKGAIIEKTWDDSAGTGNKIGKGEDLDEGESVAKAEGTSLGKTGVAGLSKEECSAGNEAKEAYMAKAKEGETTEIEGTGVDENKAEGVGVVIAKSGSVGEDEYYDIGFEDEAVGGTAAENPVDNLLLYDLDEDDEKPYIVQNGEEFFGEPNNQVDHLFHARYVLILYR